jgi:hypothetical protein
MVKTAGLSIFFLCRVIQKIVDGILKDPTIGKILLCRILVPEVVADDCTVVMLDPKALLVDLVVETVEIVAAVEVPVADAVDDVDPLLAKRYEGMFIPLVHVGKSTLQLFVVQRQSAE